MSVENVNVFFEKVSGNEELQMKLKALAEREKGIYADLVKIASEVGCNFTAQDARKAHVKTVRELSKEKLDQVTGGEFINSGAWTGT
ncbi:MAG: Nif11-like leader peptide family natural product precursor [bacterium]|nr:Nif11-like leader peptide family natural product precursor [bacterium]